MRAIYDAQHNERCAYTLSQSETPVGLTLGNNKTFATATSNGAVRGLWSADTDLIVFGTQQLAYRLAGAKRTLFAQHIERTLTLCPHAQISEFALAPGLNVRETFFVPLGEAHRDVVSFVLDIEVQNTTTQAHQLQLFSSALLLGQRFAAEVEANIRAAVESGRICATNPNSGATRYWGSSCAPQAVQLALRHGPLQAGIEQGALSEATADTSVAGPFATGHQIFGAFQFELALAAGASTSLRLCVAFHPTSAELAAQHFAALLNDTHALADTQAYYAQHLRRAQFLTPSAPINRGVVWAKVNMLRVPKAYPQGWGSTNSPPSDIIVARDTSWFVHGYDYFWPEFSRDALDVFHHHLAENGQVVEYVRGVTGKATNYGLSLNDDTPLHLIALLHIYNTSRDLGWIRERLPFIHKIADYLLAQRDERGLLFCRADGADLFGITSWRNIIPAYTLDGAVTEIQAEGVFALRAAARLCTLCGESSAAQEYAQAADALQSAIRQYLYCSDIQAFILNVDQYGDHQDDITADEIFPVLFEVANPAQRLRLLARLSEPDFVTSVGLRTVSNVDSWYAPSHGFGLLGGIWPDLTLWFAVALARNGLTQEAAHWLSVIASTMESGSARNTVPGQFPEWFDGAALVNRGMYLSPWTGAKYLWAVAESIGGFDGYCLDDDSALAPLLPPDWQWCGAGRVQLAGGECSYVVDVAQQRIYTDTQNLRVRAPYRAQYLGRDISDECVVAPAEVGVLAFVSEAGELRVFLGNTDDTEREVTLRVRDIEGRFHLAAGGLLQLVNRNGVFERYMERA